MMCAILRFSLRARHADDPLRAMEASAQWSVREIRNKIWILIHTEPVDEKHYERLLLALLIYKESDPMYCRGNTKKWIWK